MTNVAIGVKDLLVAANIGAFAAASGWSINISKEPISPNTTITIFNTAGRPPNPKWLLDYPSLNIRVRGSKGGYVNAEDKAKEVKDVLLGFDSQDINGDRWVSVTMPGDLIFIGYDENERPMFSLNFRLIVEPATSALTNRQAL